jgi:glucarate dehydratase
MTDRIARIDITPVAFRDAALLNAVGVHEPFALRAIVELTTESGATGLGETYADDTHLARLRAAADAINGLDVFSTNAILSAIRAALSGTRGADRHGLTGQMSVTGTADRVFAPFETACLDIQGKLLGRPVTDLLGGAVRDRVPFSAYLFYKWAAHPGRELEADRWGEALDPAGIVAQARALTERYGFTALKLKGGVYPPDQECEAIEALRDAFPESPLRLDPNAAWTVETSVKVGTRLDGILEYLEDPTPGRDGMAEVARRVRMPLATNMCVVSFDEILPALEQGSVKIVLSDHHYWGGLQRSRLLAGICDTVGWGLSMHSNSHLGVSLAAMVHLAAATPNLTYACDTHWPWKREDEDVISGSPLTFANGEVTVPKAPGLGIELDRDALAALHRQYLDCGLRRRDDTAYMQRIDPSYQAVSPRW